MLVNTCLTNKAQPRDITCRLQLQDLEYDLSHHDQSI